MEERVKKLERIAERLARRSVKSAVALITPYPISGAAFGDDIRGPILRYMFPCDGAITKGMIKLGSKPPEKTALHVYLFDTVSGQSADFILEKATLSVPLDIQVSSGNCLSISIESSEPIKEAWISFLWVPSVKDVEAKSYLIDEIENLAQKSLLPE